MPESLIQRPPVMEEPIVEEQPVLPTNVQPIIPKVPFRGVDDIPEIEDMEERIRSIGGSTTLNAETKRRLLLNEAEKGNGILAGFPGFREAEQRVRQAVKMGLELITPGGDRVSEITDKWGRGDVKGAMFDVPPAIAQAATDIVSMGTTKIAAIGGQVLPAMFMGIAAKNRPKGIEKALEIEHELNDDVVKGIGRVRGDDIPETVRQFTGWFRGPDGKWRWELDDSRAKIGTVQRSGKLEDVKLLHDDLFENYPQLRSIKVEVKELEGGGYAMYNPNTNVITVDPRSGMDRRELLKTMLHEYQHAVQHVEKFAFGTNVQAEMKRPQERAKKLADRAAKLKDQISDSIKRAIFNDARDHPMKNQILSSETTYNKYLDGVWNDYATRMFPSIQKQIKYLDEGAKRLDAIKLTDEQATASYRKQAGEVEAFDTEARLHLSAKNREDAIPALLARPDVEVRRGIVLDDLD